MQPLNNVSKLFLISKCLPAFSIAFTMHLSFAFEVAKRGGVLEIFNLVCKFSENSKQLFRTFVIIFQNWL